MERWLQYEPDTGRLLDLPEKDGPGGRLLCQCYSGNGASKNVPADQFVKGQGPIVEADYALAAPVDTATHGPAVMWLTPAPGSDLRGRGGFGMHSDSVAAPGMASEGCIVNVKVDAAVAQVIAGVPFMKTSDFRRWLWAQGYRWVRVRRGGLGISSEAGAPTPTCQSD